MDSSLRTRAALMLVLTGCANTGEIEGRVVSYFDGAPVPGVEVGVGGTTLRATTSADGRYSLADVVPGSQQVRVTGAGFTEAAPLTLTVGARSTVSAEELRVLPRPPEPGVYALGEGGGLTELQMPEGRAAFTQLAIGLDLGWAAPVSKLPKSGMTAVASPMTFLVLDGEHRTESTRIYKPIKTPVLINRNLSTI